MWHTKGRFMNLWNICSFSSASLWMCPGTVSANSNTAGLLWDIHLPSLRMPKWLWRCNSLILSSEQCSSYCYGKSMWLSWRSASMGFCWGAMVHNPNLCRQYNQIKGGEKKSQNTSHNISLTQPQGQHHHRTTVCSQCRWASDKVQMRMIDDFAVCCFTLQFALFLIYLSSAHPHAMNDCEWQAVAAKKKEKKRW